MRRALLLLLLPLGACIDFGKLASDAKCDAGFTCGPDAAEPDSGAPDAGPPPPLICPTGDGGWVVAFDTPGESYPEGIATVGCRLFALIVTQLPDAGLQHELHSFDSTGAAGPTLTLGTTTDVTAKRIDGRLASRDGLLAAAWFDGNTTGALDVIDARDGGATVIRHFTTGFGPQAVTFTGSSATNDLTVQVLGQAPTYFVQRAVPVTLSDMNTLMYSVQFDCASAVVERAVTDPSGAVTAVLTYTAAGNCNLPGIGNGVGPDVAVITFGPDGRVAAASLPTSTGIDYGGLSLGAGADTWLTFDEAGTGAAFQKLSRQDAADGGLQLVLGAKTSGMGGLETGAVIVRPDGLDLFGTVMVTGQIAGQTIRGDGGDWDGYWLSVNGSGDVTGVRTFGGPGTDFFTHAIPLGDNMIAIEGLCGFGGTRPAPYGSPSDYANAFVVGVAR